MKDLCHECVERRLAVIMAADVAGYSVLMERDEEGTFARVRSVRLEVIEPRITEHRGRLIKTNGDGFLAEFSSPIAALRGALEIQSNLASDPTPLRLRVGLNLGDIIVEEGGDVFGEGVNVAARLEALADPGGILISGKIHDEVGGKVEVDFEYRGEQRVKNIKTEGSLQEWARALGRRCLIGTALAIVIVSLWTPFIDAQIAARWFSFPNIVLLVPVPLITGV